MILRLRVKSIHKTKKKQILVWVQNHKDLREEIQQLLEFFKDEIIIKKKIYLHKYYKVTSENPAIMLSLLSTVQELIPEVFFNSTNSIDLEDFPNI